MLQFTSVPSFTCPIQSFFIIRSRNLKQTYVLPSSCCLIFSKCGTLTTLSLFPTNYYHSEFQYLQVSIVHTSAVGEASNILLLSVGNYTLKLQYALKGIIIIILGFVKAVRMVKMHKCKRQTIKGTRTPW